MSLVDFFNKINDLSSKISKKISKNSQKTAPAKVEPVKPEPIKTEASKYIPLTLNDLITSSGKYKDRANSPDLTEDLKKNGEDLLKKVNALLEDLGFEGKPDISSGFRTSASNDATANAGKKSTHLIMMGLDIRMPKGKTYNVDEKLLEKHGLWQEDCQYTKGNYNDWQHFQSRPASRRHFKP